MKTRNALLKKTGILMASLFVAAILFSSCKKDKPAHVPAAGLMVYNLVPDQNALGVAADGRAVFNTPLFYLNFSGTYQALYTGNRTFQSYVYGSSDVLATTTANLVDSAYYSLFVVGTDGNYKNVFVEDKLDSLPSGTGNAYVRYINAVTGPEEHNVNISAGANIIVNESSSLGHVSSFKEVTPGDVDVTLSSEGITDTSRTISLVKDGIYTVLITGMPGATDTTTALKIRYIQNGTIAPE